MKKSLILCAALFFLIFGGACMTMALYDQSHLASRTFTEEVSSFLMTQDTNQLIVIGQKHHYIFTTNDTLKFILGGFEKNRVKATFNNFVINSDQSVSGEYTLTVDALNLPLESKKLLIAKGFVFSPTVLTYRSAVQGKRYLADQFVLPITLQFNQKYNITMHENYVSNSATIERILLTPLAIVADGVLIMGGVPLAILAIPVMAIMATQLDR